MLMLHFMFNTFIGILYYQFIVSYDSWFFVIPPNGEYCVSQCFTCQIVYSAGYFPAHNHYASILAKIFLKAFSRTMYCCFQKKAFTFCTFGEVCSRFIAFCIGTSAYKKFSIIVVWVRVVYKITFSSYIYYFLSFRVMFR